MEANTPKMLIAAFVTLILAVSLIIVIASEEQKYTTLTQIENEAVDISSARISGTDNINVSVTFTLAQAPTGWKSSDTDCNIVADAYGNSSTDFTVTTDYTVSTAGVLTLVNSTALRESPNSTLIDYKYCGNDYLAEGWNRTVLNNVPGFFALGLLGVALSLFYLIMRKEGLINI